ncbi:MAG: alanine--tRNA ligase [Cytophagales bacterium]|nr:MAG: alanine--tRNA ligase [Cytophagales bacterium]
MTSNEIRQHFLDYFTKKRQHTYVHSAPLVLKNDPTLMFTNAGMNQFKDYFLGNKVADFKRVANSQKCLRVTGKHNDLEDVGHDTYHHTMFEMLGNWSFGDYFKKEAIAWSWELLTEVYKLPKDRLYATVFGGDAKEGLEPDNEAKELWLQYLPESQILYGSKKDNFWEMGDQGPCGPCSEIHIDIRDIEEVEKISGRDLVNNDHPHVIEIWNNVFIQFNRKADGSLEQLPDKHVDTGMGFERLCMVTQGKKSNYDTDVFQPTIQFLANIASTPSKAIKYGEDRKQDIAMRVIADHIRAISFAIADGQLPSNNKAGYVIRRILRRAVRYGYTFLGFRQPFMHSLVKLLATQFADIFPEIKGQQTFIENVIREEETSFLRTLENGLKMLDEITKTIQLSNHSTIEGKTVFELYDTFGFPVDLTALIARENGLKIDEEGFKVAMQEQKDRSRQASASEKSDWITVNEGEEVEFVGYEFLESETKILRYRKLTDKKKTSYQLVLESTPFYAESGGQVGDTGFLEVQIATDKLVKIHITDTKKENDLIVHFTEDNFEEILKQLTTSNRQQLNVKAVVNKTRRSLTENNHSATHLMHAALRKVLGTHVAQKGSLVNDEILRFDFSHFAKMSEQEITEVESIVNQKIRENIKLEERRNVPIEDAKSMGAMALFGEKYGDFVRMIVFDKNYSIELCGGTHVPSTGKIGTFKIIGESSSSAGVRRIEAITAEKAEQYFNEQLAINTQLKELLKNPKDVVKAVETLIEEKAELQKQIEAYQQKEIQVVKNELLKNIQQKGDIYFLAQEVSVPNAESLRQISFELKNQVNNLFLVLAANIDGKPQISVMIADNLVKDKGLDASKIVRELAKEIQGGGGGQPFFATAGGKDVSGLGKVLSVAKNLVV